MDETILLEFIVGIFILTVVVVLYIKNKINKPTINDENINKPEFSYTKKALLTKAEISFYNKLKGIDANYIVVPQVNLAAVINKGKSRYRSELFRNIDFGIFDKEFNLLLLIELNDNTHNEYKRKKRDIKVRKILRDAKIKLLTFYTKYPNETNYFINRVMNAIKESN